MSKHLTTDQQKLLYQVSTEFKFLFIKENVEHINYVFGVLLFISYLIKVAALHKTWADDTFFTIYVTYFYLQTSFGQIFATWISKHCFELILIDFLFHLISFVQLIYCFLFLFFGFIKVLVSYRKFHRSEPCWLIGILLLVIVLGE